MGQEAPASSDPIFDENSRGYCAALKPRGTVSIFSSNIDDLLKQLSHAQIAWIDFIVDDIEKGAVEYAGKAGFSEQLVNRLLVNVSGNYEDHDTELGLLLPAIHVEGYDVNLEPLLILMRDNLIMTIHTPKRSRFYQMRRYGENYLRKLPKKIKGVDMVSLILIRIIDENNSWNFKQLQEMNERTEDLTMDLKDPNAVAPHVSDQVYQMKKGLLHYFSALWGTTDTLSSLRYGDADLISDMPLMQERIVSLQSEVHQQINLAEHLSDVLASSLESLKSIYNNQLQDRNNSLADLNNSMQERNNLLQEKNNQMQEKNNQLQDLNNSLSERNNQLSVRNNQLTAQNNRLTMLGAFLAILGAGFLVPNTIATVFSQTNIFNFSPADMTWYLLLIVVSTGVTLVLVYAWVKRIGLLPNISDEIDEDSEKNS
jgi:magnesium transporter